MTAGEILQVAAEGLTGNKMRSLLTMLGVIIGVAAVIVMMAVSAGTEAEIAEQINSLGANLIFVSRSMQRSSFNPGAGSTRRAASSTPMLPPSPRASRGSAASQWSSSLCRRSSTATSP